MNKMLRYGIYQAKISFREQNNKLTSIVVPLVAIYIVIDYARFGAQGRPSNFPYLLPIGMIWAARKLAFCIVEYRMMNIWKFYRFLGYPTGMTAVASGFLHFILSAVTCLIMAGVELFLGGAEMTISRFLLFLAGCGVGTVIYLELAAITGLCIQNPKKMRIVVNGMTLLFILLSESIFHFSLHTVFGKMMILFPNFHIGSQLYFIWNYGMVNWLNVMVILFYLILFTVILFMLIAKKR